MPRINPFCAGPLYHSDLTHQPLVGRADRISDVWQSIAAWVSHVQFYDITLGPGGEMRLYYLNVHFWVLSPKLDPHSSGSCAFGSYVDGGARAPAVALQVHEETQGGALTSSPSEPPGFSPAWQDVVMPGLF